MHTNNNCDHIWTVNVPVATIWTSPESPRKIDSPGISNPLNLEEWLQQLTYEPRLALCDDNLVQSQVLFGEEVIVEQQQGNWSHVIIPTQPSKKDQRGYPGWIPTEQLSPVKLDNNKPIVVVTNKKALFIKKESLQELTVSYLTRLPLLKRTENKVLVDSPIGSGYLTSSSVTIYDSLDKIPKQSGDEIVKTGEAFLGLAYFWGGMSAFGYDCSGFTYNMCKANGYLIPRDATDQATAGKEVVLDQIETGDLLFFAYKQGKGKLHHVGIYYGDGKMIHSPHTGKDIEITTLANTVYEKELCAARRYWQMEVEHE